MFINKYISKELYVPVPRSPGKSSHSSLHTSPPPLHNNYIHNYISYLGRRRGLLHSSLRTSPPQLHNIYINNYIWKDLYKRVCLSVFVFAAVPRSPDLSSSQQSSHQSAAVRRPPPPQQQEGSNRRRIRKHLFELQIRLRGCRTDR